MVTSKTTSTSKVPAEKTAQTTVKTTAETVKKPVAEPAKKTVAEKKPAAKKPAAKKTTTRKSAAKKTTTRKSAAKKTTTRKTAASKKDTTEVFVQYGGNEISESAIMKKVNAAWEAEGKKVTAIRRVKLYIKPEDNKAYYVINEGLKNCSTGAVDL